MIYTKFVEAFKNYTDCYCIIGGNAATILLNEDLYAGSGYAFRRTQDYDVVIIAEVKNTGFSKRFLEFIENNGYEDIVHGVDGDTKAHYYRFITNHNDVPKMIETFSHPKLILPLQLNNHKTPVPEGDDPSLSAILLNRDYYLVLKEGVIVRDGLPILDVPYLIYFKARAHLDILKRTESGQHIGHKADKTKHFNDVCQLSLLITPEMVTKLQGQDIPDSVKKNLAEFIDILETTKLFEKRFKTIPVDYRPDKDTVLAQLNLLL